MLMLKENLLFLRGVVMFNTFTTIIVKTVFAFFQIKKFLLALDAETLVITYTSFKFIVI